jgi:hypothetical protein
MSTEFQQHKTYSSFWALIIFFGAIAIVYCLQIKSASAQHRQLQASHKEISKTFEQAKKIRTIFGNLSRDLLTLAETEPVAKKITEDFKIQIVRAPQAENRNETKP